MSFKNFSLAQRVPGKTASPEKTKGASQSEIDTQIGRKPTESLPASKS